MHFDLDANWTENISKNVDLVHSGFCHLLLYLAGKSNYGFPYVATQCGFNILVKRKLIFDSGQTT